MKTKRPLPTLTCVFSLAVFCCGSLMVKPAFAQKKGSNGKSPKHQKTIQGKKNYASSKGLNYGGKSYKGSKSHDYYSGHNPGYRPSHGSKYRNHAGGIGYLDISPYGLSFGNANWGINIPRQFGNDYSDWAYPSAVPYGYASPYGGGYGYPDSYSTYESYQPYEVPGYGIPLDYGDSYFAGDPPPGLSPTEAAVELFNDDAAIERSATNEFFPQISTSAAAQGLQTRAEMAFKNGDYSQSVNLVNEALKLDPKNGRLLLFASHSNFAVANFAKSANLLNQATKSLARAEWGFVVKNFRKFYGRDDYVTQMSRLNQHINQQPNDADALALRGYHFGSLRYLDAAVSDMQLALKSDADNELANRMLPVLRPSSIPADIDDIPAPVPTDIKDPPKRPLLNESKKPIQIHGPLK